MKLFALLALLSLLTLGCLVGPDTGQDGTSGGGDGGGPCCMECSSKSQPCGDTCISNDKTCHTPHGCAC